MSFAFQGHTGPEPVLPAPRASQQLGCPRCAERPSGACHRGDEEGEGKQERG
eukprot:CAMPEP_0197543876 /NCGR_PEP_ID=MMETSP1318-20131121/68476_1 /TAXON_ID=552666 /ORGANISM="Partenskyella glossopodia, Strain RCC365" /LENGTH=51 /DNA_ID=CAMNT_0043103245 /DNA_START=681 /DNA_END=833 /DNA_ORIENTATION=-